MQNINVSGTFQEYMESVEIEVQRQLGCDYAVNLRNVSKLVWFDDGIEYLAYIIEIFDNEGWRVHFGICEKEFDQNKHQPEALIELARIRFVDAEWSLKREKGANFSEIRRLNK